MPVPKSVTTGSMIMATVLTAAGLNLGILDIGKEASDTETSAATPVAEGVADDMDVQALGAPNPPIETNDGRSSGVMAAGLALRVKADNGLQPSAAVSGDGIRSAGSDDDHADSDDDDDYDDDDYDDDDYDDDDYDDDVYGDSSDRPSTTTEQRAPSSTTTSTNERTASSSTTGQSTMPSTTDTASPPAARTEYLTYEFDGVASVIVAFHDGKRLEFWSAIPEDGWVFRVDDNHDDLVKIKFRPLDGGDEAEFVVKLDDGEIKVKKEH